MDLARVIDHTALKPETTLADVDRLIDEAIEHRFASVCVNSCYAAHAAGRLRGSGVPVCSVVAFPLGAMQPTAKAIETTVACKDGATEIDFVAHLPHLLAADVDAAREDFLQVTRNARSVNPGVVVKVIIESALLMHNVSEDQAAARISVACRAAQESGCDFVKTSTGFHSAGGASIAAVKMMKQFAGPLRVKASGGIRTRDDALAMLDAGADRLGCSAGVAIIQNQE